MDDLISRQAAIDEAKEWIDAVYFEENDKRERKAIECFIGSLKNMPSAQPEQQWIPCSERLPEEDFWSGRGRQFSEHVLVTIVNRGNDDERFTDIAQTVDGIWQLSHDVDGDCSLPNWCEVIAWMPLPEPYKGEET